MEFILFFAILIIATISILHNSIISAYETVKQSQAAINTYAKHKSNTLEKLEPFISSYASHEINLLKEITALRQKNSGLDSKHTSGNNLDKTQNTTTLLIKDLNSMTERNAELKSNSHYVNLIKSLENHNENSCAADLIYIRNINFFNNKIARNPTKIVNNLFTKKERFPLL